jgi:hypothetical protein
MQYIFTGFTHETGFRVFAFQAVARDRERNAYSVSVDLALSRKYGIRVQELPLLCCGVLERSSSDDDCRAFVFTENDMLLRSLAAAPLPARRKPPRPAPAPRSLDGSGVSIGHEEHNGNAGDSLG